MEVTLTDYKRDRALTTLTGNMESFVLYNSVVLPSSQSEMMTQLTDLVHKLFGEFVPLAQYIFEKARKLNKGVLIGLPPCNDDFRAEWELLQKYRNIVEFLLGTKKGLTYLEKEGFGLAFKLDENSVDQKEYLLFDRIVIVVLLYNLFVHLHDTESGSSSDTLPHESLLIKWVEGVKRASVCIPIVQLDAFPGVNGKANPFATATLEISMNSVRRLEDRRDKYFSSWLQVDYKEKNRYRCPTRNGFISSNSVKEVQLENRYVAHPSRST